MYNPTAFHARQGSDAALGEGERAEGASGRGRNPSIEGLRGFSALIVILYHLHNMAIIGGFGHPSASRVLEKIIAGLGPFGVMLFFMISGYLIVQSLIKYDNIPLFFKHRAVRIYPVFLLLQIIVFSFGPLVSYGWMGPLRHSASLFTFHFITNLLFLPGIFSLPIAQKNAWSLSYEFAFYLTAATLYFALARHMASPIMSRVALLLGLAIGIAVLYTHPLAWFFAGGTVVFFAGTTRAKTWITSPSHWVLGVVLLVLAFAAFVLNVLWLSVIFGALFFATVVNGQGIFSRLLCLQPMQFLGRISYSLYLVHPFVLDALRSVIRRMSPQMHVAWLAPSLFGLSGLTLAVIVASLMYRFVEVGFTNRFLRRRSVL